MPIGVGTRRLSILKASNVSWSRGVATVPHRKYGSILARAAGRPNRLPRGGPSIDPLQRSSHEHRLVILRQPIRDPESLDPFPVGEERHGARPVRSPYAAIEAIGIDDARDRVPDVPIGE